MAQSIVLQKFATVCTNAEQCHYCANLVLTADLACIENSSGERRHRVARFTANFRNTITAVDTNETVSSAKSRAKPRM